MQIFLINLDSATSRLSAAKRQLDLLGLPFERVTAMRGSALSPSERASLYSQELNAQRYFQPLSDGEIGCYASHISVWQAMKRRRLPYCLILEDDLGIDARLPGALQAIEQLPIGWDVIRLNSRVQEKIIASYPLVDDTKLIRFARVPSRTTAYVISATGVDKLLGQVPPVYRPIDIDMRYFWQFNLDMLGISPAVVTESSLSLQSSIDRPARKSFGMKRRVLKVVAQFKYTCQNYYSRSKKMPWD
jgi:glycosyl transferase, family 25